MVGDSAWVTNKASKLCHVTSQYQNIINTTVGQMYGYARTTIDTLPSVLYLDLCNIICTAKRTRKDEFKL